MTPHPPLSKEIVEHIIIQECRLLDRTESPQILAALIDDEFTEIGSSADSYNKADVTQWLSTEDKSTRSATSFAAKKLANDIILLTYTSHIQDYPGAAVKNALRSSIWRKKDNQWLMVFHQGTPNKTK